MIDHEWVHLTPGQLSADPALEHAIRRFKSPPGPAGDAAAAWLKDQAVQETETVATYLLVICGEIAGFYSLGMGEVELRSGHQKKLSVSHPRQGAVLILWLARSHNASIDGEVLLRHAVGIAQIGARHVGAAVIALDPFDDETAAYWRERFGFRTSRSKRDSKPRLWMPLYPQTKQAD